MRHAEFEASPAFTRITPNTPIFVQEPPVRLSLQSTQQPGCSEIPEFLFRLALTALRDGYPATAAGHLHSASIYLRAAAGGAPDAAQQATLRRVAAQLRLAAVEMTCAESAASDVVALFAQAQLALAHCEQRLALHAWLRRDVRRAGCHLDSAIRQLHRAEAWIDYPAAPADADDAPESEAQRIADALAEGWQVHNDRVSALVFGLELEISRLAAAVRPMPFAA